MAPIDITNEMTLTMDPGILACILEMQISFPENLLRAIRMADSMLEAYFEDEEEEELEGKARIFFELALGYQSHELSRKNLGSGISYLDRIVQIIEDKNAKIYLYLALREQAWKMEA